MKLIADIEMWPGFQIIGFHEQNMIFTKQLNGRISKVYIGTLQQR